jgi:two-component system NtrC family sensor kinase
MDLPLRTKLLVCFLSVALLVGLLAVVVGSVQINEMVVGEAQRRVAVALKTARAVLQQRLDEGQKNCDVIADWITRQPELFGNGVSQGVLEGLREKSGFDYLQVLDQEGVVVATARGDARGMKVADTPVVRAALKQGRAAAGTRLMTPRELSAESAQLASRAYVEVVPTARAKTGGPEEIREALVMEVAAPIIRPPGTITGVVRGGVVLTRNFGLVDFIRDSIFTQAVYKGKDLGTVTIFLRDVRVATNVMGPDDERAIGTQVSEEVHDKVLGRGETWIGPAFVVGSWYVSAYEPIRDPDKRTIGVLYVGVLKDRYDEMSRQVMAVFVAVLVAGLIVAVAVSTWLAGRLARPIMRLNHAAAQVAQGNLAYRLPEPTSARQDEVKRLTVSFNEMLAALGGRDEKLRHSNQDLERAAGELKRWNQNYLDTLEFITHELKNQVAAMKINLLALRDGYVGALSTDQEDALGDVLLAVNRTEEMILNYLNLSRIEKGELEVRTRPVQVEVDVVRPVLREIKARLDEKAMEVEVDLPEDLMVQADPSLLQIVYENLLSNAAKYGKDRGLVRIWGSRRDGWVELHVWNEGMGVPADQVGELFRKFSRLQPPGEQERGTGLGLFITREIVHKLGGEIRAESEDGRWIDFIFILPRPDTLLEIEPVGQQEQLL